MTVLKVLIFRRTEMSAFTTVRCNPHRVAERQKPALFIAKHCSLLEPFPVNIKLV